MNVDQPVCSFLADRFQFVHSFLKTRERLYVWLCPTRGLSQEGGVTHILESSPSQQRRGWGTPLSGILTQKPKRDAGAATATQQSATAKGSAGRHLQKQHSAFSNQLRQENLRIYPPC